MDKESLLHTRANCKYHIVFTPKYRRQVIYGQLRKDIGEILRTLSQKNVYDFLHSIAPTQIARQRISRLQSAGKRRMNRN